MKLAMINKYMSLAAGQASRGVRLGHGGPFGAVIVKGGRIIAQAHNTVLKTFDPTAHAEINAIRIASKKLRSFDLSGTTLITTCEPCPMCLSAIMWAKIDMVYFSATRKDAESAGFRDDLIYDVLKGGKKHLTPLIGIPSKDVARAFEEWQNKTDRKTY